MSAKLGRDYLEDVFIPRDLFEKFGIIDDPNKLGLRDEPIEIQILRLESVGDITCGGYTIWIPEGQWAEIVHDCMWSGTCNDKRHLREEQEHHNSLVRYFSAYYKQDLAKPSISTKQGNGKPSATSQQQSILKATILFKINAPQTPPMSDEEEVRFPIVFQQWYEIYPPVDKNKDPDVFSYLHGKLEFDSEGDTPTSESEDENQMETTDVTSEVQKNVNSNIKSNQYATANDHSYHKNRNTSLSISELGLDTPSESDEDVDEESALGQTFTNKPCLFPNSQNRDSQFIIRRRMVATAASENMLTGIKTIMPIKKQEKSQTKRSTPKSRNVKRSRQYRKGVNNTSYRRRSAGGASSDSEQEPSEKRSLHNNMERQRRVDLRNAFEYLRTLIPEVAKKERAAKVVILREAAQLCKNLQKTSQYNNMEEKKLLVEQDFLSSKLSNLRFELFGSKYSDIVSRDGGKQKPVYRRGRKI